MKDKKFILAVGLLIIAIVVTIISFIFRSENDVEEEKINIVVSYSDFYTVNSCLHRMVTYLSNKDSDSMYLVLDEEYKKNNNITKDNVLNSFPQVELNSTFVSEKMYYQVVNENIVKYYVMGYIKENKIIDDTEIVIDNNSKSYFVVYLDRGNKIFSVEIYDGDLFINGDENE